MKNCPFCGFDEVWIKPSGDDNQPYVAKCKVCDSTGPKSKTPEGAEEKWDGILKSLSFDELNDKLTEDMGGVSAPAATLVNTPGMGNAVPAATAAMTGAQQTSPDALGSGDTFGATTKKKKKKSKKKKLKTEVQKALKGFANLVENGHVIKITDGLTNAYIKKWTDTDIEITKSINEALVFKEEWKVNLKTKLLNEKYFV